MKQKRDLELIRIQALVRSIDELIRQYFKFRKQLGDSADERTTQYIAHRFGWFFRRFNQPPKQ
jgi:hypothetical protein